MLTVVMRQVNGEPEEGKQKVQLSIFDPENVYADVAFIDVVVPQNDSLADLKRSAVEQARKFCQQFLAMSV